MTNEDKQEFAKIMFGLAEESGAKITRESLAMKFDALQDFNIAQVKKAATHLIRYRKVTYPPIPTIKEFFEILEPQPTTTLGDLAEIQANEVTTFLKYYASTRTPKFKDPITQNLMSTVWPYRTWASTVLVKDLVWWKKEFIEAYISANHQETDLMLETSQAPKNVLKLVKNIGSLPERKSVNG